MLPLMILSACTPAETSKSPSSPVSDRTPSPTVIKVTVEADLTGAPAPTPTEIPDRPQPPTDAADSEPWTSPVDGMTLLPVPAGGFWMGTLPSFELAEPDEMPQQRVTLSGYWIDQTEVSRAMYALCMEQAACSGVPVELSGDGNSPHMPQTHVTWEEAGHYCRWAGRQLPTEAQWEKAARGSDGRRFPWGWIGVAETRAGVRLNYCDASCPFPHADLSVDDGAGRLAEVGTYPAGASPLGALDMAGNVWEWVQDWYDADYYSNMPAADPPGPERGRFRGVRGSSWAESSFEGFVLSARSANRAWQLPDARGPDIGFRCAVSSQTP